MNFLDPTENILDRVRRWYVFNMIFVILTKDLVKLLTSKFGVFASYFLGNVRSIRVIVHFVLHIEGRRRSEQTNFVHFGTCPFGSSGLDKSPRASHVSRREHVLIYICNANHVFFYGCHPLSRFLVLFLLWKYLTQKHYTTKCVKCQ